MQTPAVDARAIAELIGEETADVSSRRSDDRSTHSLESVRAITATGREVDLILKGMRTSRARGDFVRPRLVRDERREAWAYAALLDPDVLDTPRCLGVLNEGESDERLVLEAVPGRPLTETGDMEAWRAAARWLAAFHEWGERAVARLRDRSRLLDQSPELHERWLRRARRGVVAGHGPLREPRLDEIESAYQVAVARVAGGRRGLVHGEFYPSNIIVQVRASGWRIRTLDWESIGHGPVVLDLAALTTGDWDADARASLWEAYEEARGLAAGALTADLHAARLINAAQWLGWTRGWRPPAEHARDWLAEATDAARHVLGEPTAREGDAADGPPRRKKLSAF